MTYDVRNPGPGLGQVQTCGRSCLMGSQSSQSLFIRPSRDRPYYVIGFHRAIMWSSLVKIQYTELKLSCGNDPVVKISIYNNGDLDLWGSFPHDNFSFVYWIFTKLDHMILLWKGKNPIYFGVITIIQFDNLYRQAYFVMHTFLVLACIVILVVKNYIYSKWPWPLT
jgi:hypothetical protein